MVNYESYISWLQREKYGILPHCTTECLKQKVELDCGHANFQTLRWEAKGLNQCLWSVMLPFKPNHRLLTLKDNYGYFSLVYFH